LNTKSADQPTQFRILSIGWLIAATKNSENGSCNKKLDFLTFAYKALVTWKWSNCWAQT